ncbi:MAG: hypothetical protein AAF849_23825 [Bacteroidota bacterium]
MTTVEAFEQIADHLALISPEKIVALKAPATMAARVETLIYKKKEEGISKEESTELERYLALDLLINLAKARAKYLMFSA